ncbi:putative lipoprotein involved in colanic acid biosynthesis [Escherichia coli]|uniref:Putative lipoprotein involved in colanic acid biosynthesis n=1 Tax=Escherichia coli TaxID=562 RepID=A0A377D1M4_ECOLX|nr:putative lipoprotein involved in colanic acid biosynthesis [Escherichia coli]
MKVNLMLFSLFLLVSIMACNVFAFSISGGGSETSYKETEKNVSDDDNSFYKTSAITGDFV